MISVSDSLISNASQAASIISAPIDASLTGAQNLGQQGFDEMQNVLLAADLEVDFGFIAAGTRVDSHMIFLNNSLPGFNLFHIFVEWEFSGTVLGVMSNEFGFQEFVSNPIVGLPGTFYGTPTSGRGLEVFAVHDGYSIIDNRLVLSMDNIGDDQGDWIRVITAIPSVPEPSILIPLGLGLAGLGFSRGRAHFTSTV